MNRKIFEKYIKKLPKNAKLLDIGCSNCVMIKSIKKFRPDIQFYAINITMKDYAVPDYVHFKISNVEQILHEDQFFDAVLCFHLLEHVKNPFTASNEIFRVLKKGGLFFGESPHWISMITPFGYNFFDDPSHIKPFSVEGFKNLINVDEKYEVLYKKFDNPNFIHYPKEYFIKKNFSYFLRLFLKSLGLYRCVAAVILKKKQEKKIK